MELDEPTYMTPQARRRLHSTMSRSELRDLAEEMAVAIHSCLNEYRGRPDLLTASLFVLMADRNRDPETARD